MCGVSTMASVSTALPLFSSIFCGRQYKAESHRMFTVIRRWPWFLLQSSGVTTLIMCRVFWSLLRLFRNLLLHIFTGLSFLDVAIHIFSKGLFHKTFTILHVSKNVHTASNVGTRHLTRQLHICHINSNIYTIVSASPSQLPRTYTVFHTSNGLISASHCSWIYCL